MLRVIAIAVAGLIATHALAGDSATFAPIGYSADHRYFAYEEFSIGDEGTPPSATIGIVDLTTGAPVSGSPWTATGGDDVESTLTTVRLDVTTLAAGALMSTAIEDPAHYLALIGDGVRDEGDELRFALPQGADPDALGPTMVLDLIDLPALIEDHCSADYGGHAVGVTVMLSPEDRASTRELARREAADGTQDCVRRFRLYGVLQPYNGGDMGALVAVVSVYTVGFEGYDRRFMVIPFGPAP